MTRVRFTSEVRLDWPASTTWYLFLKELHRRLAQAERMCYDDKDIMMVSEIQFQDGEHGYQRVKSLIVNFVRFNERGNVGHADHIENIVPAYRSGMVRRQYRIELEMSDLTAMAFNYERIS